MKGTKCCLELSLSHSWSSGSVDMPVVIFPIYNELLEGKYLAAVTIFLICGVRAIIKRKSYVKSFGMMLLTWILNQKQYSFLGEIAKINAIIETLRDACMISVTFQFYSIIYHARKLPAK